MANCVLPKAFMDEIMKGALDEMRENPPAWQSASRMFWDSVFLAQDPSGLRKNIASSAVQLPTSWSASTDTGSVGAAARTPSRAAEIDCKMCGMTVAEHERRSACDTKWYGTTCNGDLHYVPMSRRVPVEQDDPGDADFTTGPLISRARFHADVDMRGCYGTPAADNAEEASVAYAEALKNSWTETWEQLAADILNKAFETGGDGLEGRYITRYSWRGHPYTVWEPRMPMRCPQAERKPPERLTDLEVDGSIGKAMRDIMKQEGRQPPEWLDADKEAKSG